MADVDTSSYLKPTAPAAKSLIESATDYGKLENTVAAVQRQKIGVEKDKLDLVTQQWNTVSKMLSPLALDPNAKAEDVQKSFQQILKQGLMSPEQYSTAVAQIPTDPKQIQNFVRNKVIQGQSNVDALHHVYGTPGAVDTGQNIQPTVSSPFIGTRPQGPAFQKQLPPGVEVPDINPATGEPDINRSPRFLGAQGQPTQMVPPAGSRLPVAAPGPVPGQPSAGAPGLPVAPPAGTVAVPTTSYTQANPQGVPTPKGPAAGFAPGAVEAAKITGGASGTGLAAEQEAGRNYQREIFPLQQAIPALEKLGTKGTGPGTETINHLKSFVLSNVPGVKASDFTLNDVKDYDKAKKYLTDFVNQTGNSGTNDKLAAAFAGNPSVGISNAAAVDVAKSALALRNMRQAQLMEFKRTGLGADKYANWASDWSNNHDPRAFGVNLLTPEAARKLNIELSKPGHEKERAAFANSLTAARQFGLIPAPGQ